MPAADNRSAVSCNRAREERRERGSIDLDLGFRAGERRKLEASSLESFRKNAPPRAIEPERLRDPSTLVHEQVQVPIDGVEPESTHGAGERVERTAHVERLDGDEHANCGREAQHE